MGSLSAETRGIDTLSYSMEQQRAFRARLRRGLIHTDCSLPVKNTYYGKTDRQAFSKKMMFEDLRELHSQEPQPETLTIVDYSKIPDKTLNQIFAQLRYLQNKVMEKRVDEKKGNSAF